MREISGFGGSYEAACRAMVSAGLDWFDANPNAKPAFNAYANIIGIISEDNADAKALSEACLNAKIIMDGKETTVRDDCTGAMHHYSVMHCFRAHKIGWDKYCAEMREAEKTT